jgi:hypothetical protein
MVSGVSIDGVRARAFKIPTDRPEADGTISWNSTTLVLKCPPRTGDIPSPR